MKAANAPGRAGRAGANGLWLIVPQPLAAILAVSMVHATVGIRAPANKTDAGIPTVAWTIQRRVDDPKLGFGRHREGRPAGGRRGGGAPAAGDDLNGRAEAQAGAAQPGSVAGAVCLAGPRVGPKQRVPCPMASRARACPGDGTAPLGALGRLALVRAASAQAGSSARTYRSAERRTAALAAARTTAPNQAPYTRSNAYGSSIATMWRTVAAGRGM
jgi:hypothetical protein